MKKGGFTGNIRLLVMSFLCLLIFSIPVAFSVELNLVYDENGNLITGDGKFREYNDFNQLERVRNGTDGTGDILEEYLYHPTEDKVLAKKVYNMSGSIFPEEVDIYVNDNFVRNISNIGGTLRVNDTYYVKDENGIVGEILAATTEKLFYHNDHLGSTSLITNETGDLVEVTSYEPFGAILETYYDPLGGEFKGGEVSRYYYEGKEFSGRTGEYDFHFRKYNPELMIFTQPDAGLNNIYNPQELNRYMFERGNPYTNIDPTGHQPKSQAEGGIIFGAPYGAWLAKEFRRIAAREELYHRLLNEYYKEYPYTSESCFGCRPSRKPPSIQELEKRELKKEMDIVLNKDYEIIGYIYKNKYISSVSTLQEMGFSKSAVKTEAQEKQSYYKSKGYSNQAAYNKAAWEDLRQRAESADKGETAGDIIREWRKEWNIK